MDDVTGGFASAWKGAMKGMKSGYKKTKSALKSIDKQIGRMAGPGSGMSHGDVRRLFQMKYGAEVRNEEGTKVAAAEASDVDTDDEEPLTDELVHERVDKVFFDRDYTAAKYEITRMEVTYADNVEETKAERERAETRILELRLKCDTVSTTLKKRVLAHHQEFVSGIEDIRKVNDSLFQTSSDCKKARTSIRKSRGAVVSQIELLAQHRTRCNVDSALALLHAMKRMLWRRDQLLALVNSGKLVEASKLLKDEGTIEMEAQLSRIYCMKAVLREWHMYRDDPQRLSGCIETVLTECLTVKFMATTYRNVMESAVTLGTPQHTCGLIAALLWRSAVQILTRSLVELSYIKDESASIADIAEGIHPDHLLVGLCQTGVRLMDFFNLFVNVMRIHREESAVPNSPFAALHQQALQHVQDVGRKIGRDLVEKLTLALSSARLSAIAVDHVLHIFVVVSLLIEASSALCPSNTDDIASARTQSKAVLSKYMMKHFQRPKALEVLQFMTDDTWNLSDVSAPSLNIVRPLAADRYRKQIRDVKAYLSDDTAIAVHDNPFYSPSMVMPQDTSRLVHMETFGAYWAELRDPSKKEGGTPDASRGTSPMKGSVILSSSAAADDTLAAHAVMPPMVLTSSAISACNAFMEYAARVGVRFPPLAADILGWTEDLVGLYMFTVADNFVSVSRSVPVERQGDFSLKAQTKLADMRAAGERAVDAVNGYYSIKDSKTAAMVAMESGGNTNNSDRMQFPPRVWGRIRQEFASEQSQYALGSRAVACEACVTLTFLHEAVVRSFMPLLPPSLVAHHLSRCRDLYTTAVEVLHVCIHRLCMAIFPMESVCTEISKLKSKDEVKVSKYVTDLVTSMKALNNRRQAMPTPPLENLFLQRFIFVVQSVLVREYSKLSKKKLSDIAVMQIQVDVQNFQQQAATAFGRENIALPDYVLGLVKTGFYMGDREQLLGWLRKNHVAYSSADLVLWLSGGDKVFKGILEDTLRELQHHDALPVDKFIQQL